MNKPTKPGFYWLNTGDEWTPVRILMGYNGLRVQYLSDEEEDYLSMMRGEPWAVWGPEIIPPFQSFEGREVGVDDE